jgi:hypothetical protein
VYNHAVVQSDIVTVVNCYSNRDEVIPNIVTHVDVRGLSHVHSISVPIMESAVSQGRVLLNGTLKPNSGLESVYLRAVVELHVV